MFDRMGNSLLSLLPSLSSSIPPPAYRPFSHSAFILKLPFALVLGIHLWPLDVHP